MLFRTLLAHRITGFYAMMLIATVGFALTTKLVSTFRQFAYRYQLLDVPNSRSSHKSPTPSAGGVAMVVAFFISLILLFFFHLIDSLFFKILLSGGVLLACIGLLDDLWHVPAKIRLLCHFMAASWILVFLKDIPFLDLGFTVWYWQKIGLVVALLGLVWLINLYNFMDGIDGLAASEALFVTLAMAFLLFLKNDTYLTPVFILLAAITGAFLIWNWSPAKVFMGDTGSGFLGFIFGVLLMGTLVRGALSPWQWLIIMGCFWVDATITLFQRMIRGEAWYQAHCCHAFQQAVKKYGCHKKVVWTVMCINILWLLPLAVTSLYLPKWVLLLTFMAIAPLVILCILLKAGISTSNQFDDKVSAFLDEGQSLSH